jgi:hypothetical protein
MKTRLALLSSLILLFGGYGVAQSATPAKAAKKDVSVEPSQPTYRSSPAYAELLLRRTELTASLEALVLQYTDEYPKVKESRYLLTLIERDAERLSKVKPADQGRLTLALGKLLVKKLELEADLWNLQKDYKEEHPDVKRAKRRVEIYETAISEILN